MKHKNYEKYFWYISIILFASILIIKLIQLSKMVYLYPSYDFSSHIVHLFFLKEYGFHGLAQNWYNGFIVLQDYPPLFSFLAYLFYSIIDNIQLAFYISFIGVIIIGFFGVYLLGKVLNISIIKRLFLFFFFYANPITIPWFYIIGRVPEMLAWSLMFYLLAVLFYYKDKKLDKKFFIFLTMILTLILLAHLIVFILSLFLIFGLFLIKSNKERLKIIISLIITFLLSSFWSIDFIKNIGTIQYTPSTDIHITEIIYSIVIPLTFLGILYLYINIKDLKKKELLFYIPIVLIAILYLTHLFSYIPILKIINSRTYGILLLIFSILLVFHIKLNKKAFKLISINILIFSLIITIVSFIKYPIIDFPLYSEKNQEIIRLLPLIKDKFIIIEKDGSPINKHIYAYATIKYNLSTSFGWIEDSEYFKNARDNLKKFINGEDCKGFNKMKEELKFKEIIAHESKCKFLKTCNLNQKEISGRYCLLK